MSALEKLDKLAEKIRNSCQKEVWFFWSWNKATSNSVHRSQYYIPIEWDPNSKRVMFVAPNPSLQKREGKASWEKLEAFLKILERHNFAKENEEKRKRNDDTCVHFRGSFVTDLIKTRLGGKDAGEYLKKFKEKPEEVSSWVQIIEKEVETVDPLLIVAMGDNVYRALVNVARTLNVETLNRPIERIYHYGVISRFPDNKGVGAIDKQMGRIEEVYKFLCSLKS